MKISRSIFPLVLVLVLSACSNTRFLAEDQFLYTGRDKVNITYTENASSKSLVNASIKSVTDYKVNNALLGKRILPPVGLWVHNYWYKEANNNKEGWLFKTLSSSPILLSDVTPELRALKIESELFDLGYFQTKAWSVIEQNKKNPKKVRVSYFVEIAPPYVYNEILFDTLRGKIDTLISQHNFKTHIKKGAQYNLEYIKSARSELFRRIQNEGYFYFSPDFIELSADTSLGNYKLNLGVRKRDGLPPAVLSNYTIDDISIHISKPDVADDSLTEAISYENISIVSSGVYINPEVLARAIYFKKGDNYSYSAYQHTISRLNNLGVFGYVRIYFEQSESDSLHNRLNIRIDLSMAKNINLYLEAELATKSTGYAGPQIFTGISNNNAFKGAEKIQFGLNGGFEWQWGRKSASQLGTFSYELGVNSGLTLPKILIPKSWSKNKPLEVQQTSVNVDFNLLNRTAYYQMFSSMVNINYTWGETRKIKHSFSPFYLNSVALLNTTPEFDSVVDENIYIRKSFEEQFIFGARYDFTFDNTQRRKTGNIYFQTSINTSGNIIDLFARMGKEETERPYYFLNNIYSQYVKLTSDFRYYLNGVNRTLVLRLYAGTGLPYGNSKVLPYVEQFFSGGAYSIRGFTARYLGPGSYHEDKSGYIDQSGDMKLEANLEYRFGLSKIVKGALFLETGNIWLINEDVNRPGAKFDINTFHKELAVGTGMGLRFDFTFFILRADVGFPLRTPYLTDEKYWLPGTGKSFSDAMFYLAIGYPF